MKYLIFTFLMSASFCFANEEKSPQIKLNVGNTIMIQQAAKKADKSEKQMLVKLFCKASGRPEKLACEIVEIN